MKRKPVILLIIALFLVFGCFPKWSITYASEGVNVESDVGDSSYYLINYNGESEQIVINENITLILNGWESESHSSVNGKIYIYNNSSLHTEDVTLSVSTKLLDLSIVENERINYRILEADNYGYEIIKSPETTDQVVVVKENENGTSIEKVNKIDKYGTIIETNGLSYYKINEENQKVKIAEEEYDFYNSVSQDSLITLQPNHEEFEVKESTEEIKINSTSETNEGVNEFNSLSFTESPSIKYSTHVEGIGWQNPVFDGQLSGTEGQAKRIEAIQVSLDNTPYTGGISYRTHVQGNGWLPNVSNGKVSGTTGERKRVEAIQINLTDEMEENFDVYYRVHAQTFGWLGWAKNGDSAGTEGLARRVEAIEIVLVEKGGAAPGSLEKSFLTKSSIKPSVSYSTHVETFGWLDFVTDGSLSGTEGERKRLEAVKINLENATLNGSITYSTHVQSNGWLENVSNGEISGTVAERKRVEAIRIGLTGEIANHFDVYYRVHSEHFGWLGWAKNHQPAGTEGLSKRLEALEIVIVEKGAAAPGSTARPFISKPSVVYSTHVQSYGWLGQVADEAVSGTIGKAKRLEAIKLDLENSPFSGDIVYSTHVQKHGWISNVSNGEVSGTSGESKRIEAIRIDLTGEIANYYDVYYRVHSQAYGWLGWAKNGMKAGTEGQAKRLEAIEVKLVPKGQGELVNEHKAFRQQITVFLDPGHGGSDPGAVAGGSRESDLNFAVAQKVQSLLLQRGYLVYMSRYGDNYLSLYDRPQMANDLNADIFVSIHTNSTAGGSTTVQGIESYYYEYYPEYPSKINEDMHNDPLRVQRSVKLANLIHDNMIQYTSANDRGTDGDTFAVIREASMPATLIEMGFINNASERQKLITQTYQNKLAKAIADGIDEYFAILK